jgi:hypothetical protein
MIIIVIIIIRIKPVFVFDGAPPQLKKDTLARRRMRSSKDSKGANVASQKILGKYLQRQAVAQKVALADPGHGECGQGGDRGPAPTRLSEGSGIGRGMLCLTPTCWGSTTGSASCSSTGGSASF